MNCPCRSDFPGVRRVITYLCRQPRGKVLLLTALLLAISGWIDCATGTALSVDLIYLFPIGLVTVAVNACWGYLFACLSAGVWLLADCCAAGGYSQALVPCWNALIRMATFLLCCAGFGAFVGELRQVGAEKAFHIRRVEGLRTITSGIAHDFNNLLQIAAGYAEMALESPHLASGAHEALREVSRAIQRMADLTRQMQIYAGGFLVLPHAVNLSREVQKLQAEMNAMLPDTVVTNYDLASDMAEVRGDPNLLREILRNLMLNAKDAIMAVGLHGTITVRTATITLSPPDRAGAVEGSCELKPGDCAVLEVADTGCGMNSDTRARIFDPFFSTKFIGRGIGLPVVLGIVREMQGAIYVTSSVGKGTTIRVVFPIAAPAGAPAPQPKPAHLAIRPQATILVADDEPDILCVTRQGLQSAGFKVLTAADGEAAVELFRRNVSDVSLVLLDLSMPKMDGVAAFRRIRDLRADVPVIIVSGYGEQVVRDRFGDTPPSDFLQKPYTALDLGQRLRTFVLSAASAGPAATFSTSVQASS